MPKKYPVCRWCNQPADTSRNLVRTAGYYEHPQCVLAGTYQQVEAVSFPGVKAPRPPQSQPTASADHEAEPEPALTGPAQPLHAHAAAAFAPTDTDPGPDYLLDPDPYPGHPLAPAALCTDCGLFPPVPGSDECKYCAGEFEEWLAQQEAEPELAERRAEKTRYLVTTYQLIEVA